MTRLLGLGLLGLFPREPQGAPPPKGELRAQIEALAGRAGHVRAGQALRGSSEFHAWGDSNLYLRRNRDLRENGDITLTVEHRAAPAMSSVTLELAQRANALALEVIEPRTPQTPTPSSVDERITAALTDVNRPMPFAELRARCRVRTATLYERLAVLTATSRIVKTSDGGYQLVG